MSFKQSFEEVLKEAKKAFEGIEKSSAEVRLLHKNDNYKIKMVGFVGETKPVKVYR